LSSYMLYCMERRPSLSTTLSSTEKVKVMGEEWRKASKQTKAVYDKKNRELVEKYNNDLDNWILKMHEEGKDREIVTAQKKVAEAKKVEKVADKTEMRSAAPSRLVYYDLETTGLGFHNKHRDIEIVEIGAVDGETKETFRQYILPPGGHIPRDASNVHGIYLRDGALFRDEKELPAVDIKTGLQNFLDWLNSFNQPVTLAGYNSHNFDDWVVSHNFLREGMCAGSVRHFLDVAKVVRPYLKAKLGVRKWSLTFAVKTCLERDQDDAHSAVSDAVDTLDLMAKLADEEVPDKAYRTSDYIQEMCARIARGQPVEEPKHSKENKSNTIVVDKKQPLMESFFKVITNQKKVKCEENVTNFKQEVVENIVNKEQFVISTLAHVKEEETDISLDNGNFAANEMKRVRKRKSSVLNELSEIHYELPNGGLYITRSKRRRIEALPVAEENDHQPIGMKTKRGPRERAPRKPRAARAPRNPRKRNKVQD